MDNTFKLMLSDDYMERFKGEYIQLRTRTEKLFKILYGFDNDFTLTDREILYRQFKVMIEYLEIMAKRADLEGVIL